MYSNISEDVNYVCRFIIKFDYTQISDNTNTLTTLINQQYVNENNYLWKVKLIPLNYLHLKVNKEKI